MVSAPVLLLIPAAYVGDPSFMISVQYYFSYSLIISSGNVCLCFVQQFLSV